jgi:hypothetical protein
LVPPIFVITVAACADPAAQNRSSVNRIWWVRNGRREIRLQLIGVLLQRLGSDACDGQFT